MSGNFAYRYVRITSPLSPSRTVVFQSNPMRMGLMLSAIGGTSVHVFLDAGTAFTNVIAVFNPENVLVMPYRDWGPVMRESIYVGTTTAGVFIYGIEIFQVPIGE